MNLTVTTSAWGDYARFLPDWAESITRQTVPPAEVVILDAGCHFVRHVDNAHQLLTEAGIPARIVRAPYSGMGAARNAAVEATVTEWVMHLDADDILLPTALEDVTALSDEADVVSLGALRDGHPVCFPHITREQILARKHGCFSCSPFRRRFWEQRPWHTRNDFIDSVFWVGLAHLGARFAGTSRPGFVYRQHEDSFSHRMTSQQRQAATRQWKDACRSWSLA